MSKYNVKIVNGTVYCDDNRFCYYYEALKNNEKTPEIQYDIDDISNNFKEDLKEQFNNRPFKDVNTLFAYVFKEDKLVSAYIISKFNGEIVVEEHDSNSFHSTLKWVKYFQREHIKKIEKHTLFHEICLAFSYI